MLNIKSKKLSYLLQLAFSKSKKITCNNSKCISTRNTIKLCTRPTRKTTNMLWAKIYSDIHHDMSHSFSNYVFVNIVHVQFNEHQG